MKKQVIILLIIQFYSVILFSQVHYEKKINEKNFIVNIESIKGPALISIKDSITRQEDTLTYEKYVRGVDYVVYDAYIDNDIIAFVHGQSLSITTIEYAIYKNRKWEWVNFWPTLLTDDESKLPHNIKIIDRDHVRVVKNGKSYIHTLDFNKREHSIKEEN